MSAHDVHVMQQAVLRFLGSLDTGQQAAAMAAFGSPERAVGVYRKLLEVVPQHGTALRALARLLQAQGDAGGSVEALAADRDQAPLQRLAADGVKTASVDESRRTIARGDVDGVAACVADQSWRGGEAMRTFKRPSCSPSILL